MSDPLLHVASHAKKGDRKLLRLKSARERVRIARSVKSLRQWHRDLYPLVKAYNPALAESLRQQDPRPHEYKRVAGTYPSLAQARLLMTTATALYRLKPHLAQVRPRKVPGRRKGQGAYNDAAAIENMRSLIKEGYTPWSAALASVEQADQRNPNALTIAKRLDSKYRRSAN